jgi:hypothetical protein
VTFREAALDWTKASRGQAPVVTFMAGPQVVMGKGLSLRRIRTCWEESVEQAIRSTTNWGREEKKKTERERQRQVG